MQQKARQHKYDTYLFFSPVNMLELVKNITKRMAMPMNTAAVKKHIV
jgi:ABC-type Zn uptake system ZnuABC Zn-binding protein ZnuA